MTRRGTLQTAKRLKRLIVLVAFLYICSYLVGWYLIGLKSPVAVQFSEEASQAVLTEQPFRLIIQSLREGDLVKAILITFLVNLTIGAFLTTTLPGILPVIGALGIIATTLVRGFTIGVTYPEVLSSSPAAFVLGFGTLILELGAYVFSGAAGINIALAPVSPRKFGVESRWAAFKIAWRDAARIFVIVVILLASGAVWEMTLMFSMLRAT